MVGHEGEGEVGRQGGGVSDDGGLDGVGAAGDELVGARAAGAVVASGVGGLVEVPGGPLAVLTHAQVDAHALGRGAVLAAGPREAGDEEVVDLQRVGQDDGVALGVDGAGPGIGGIGLGADVAGGGRQGVDRIGRGGRGPGGSRPVEAGARDLGAPPGLRGQVQELDRRGVRGRARGRIAGGDGGGGDEAREDQGHDEDGAKVSGDRHDAPSGGGSTHLCHKQHMILM